MRYNANNQLSSIQSKNQTDNQIIKFYHDVMGRKIIEIRNNQSMLYVNDGSNVIEEYIDSEIHSSIVSDVGIDNIIEVSTNSTNYWTYADIIKCVIYTMKGQEKDHRYDYDEFGKIMTPINDGNIFSRFAGKRFIPTAEKYDFLLRTYDPKIGRFLQRDPKGYVDGTNLYTYALNNPTSRTDPFGTEAYLS